jgi:hypothetical protein
MRASHEPPRRLRRLAARLASAGLASAGLATGLVLAAPTAAHAAVPDRWGFAFVDNPSVAGIPDPNHEAGSWPPGFMVHSAPVAPGKVKVRFPMLAARGGVVHVTPVIDIAVFCDAQGWGPSGTSEVVTVRCFRYNGTPVFAPFVVLFTKSTGSAFPAGRAYGYVHFNPAKGIVASFNSAGRANAVSHVANGVWVVKMPRLGTAAIAGGVQVTAADPTGPAKCTLGRWVSKPTVQIFEVRCYHPGVVPLNTGWTISYQRKRSITGGGLPGTPTLYAYTANTMPLAFDPYSPPPPLDYNSAGGINTIQKAGTGESFVQFSRVGVLQDAVLVTGWQIGAGFCNLNSLWSTGAAGPVVIVQDVVCYDASGVNIDHKSLVSYTSSH